MAADSTPLTPWEAVRQVELALPLSTGKERRRLLEHVHAWAVVSSDGQIPDELENRIEELEAEYGISR